MQITHNEYVENTTGVLLAGGKSLRMGHDKACIEVGGSTLLSRSLDLLRRDTAFRITMLLPLAILTGIS